MAVWKAIILGIIQGLTEFLPVSSSGHLAIAQKILDLPENKVLFFTVMLHFGTLISILLVYRKDIAILIKEFFIVIYELITQRRIHINNQYRKLGVYIIIASIPAAVAGVVLEDFFEKLFTAQFAIGFALIITGLLLWLSDKLIAGEKNIDKMRPLDAFIVGVFQACAITPGISRSGSTIVGSLFMGLKKDLAVKFSFLISFPIILGAAIFEIKDVVVYGTGDTPIFIIIAGVLSSAIFGWIAIKTMINLVKKQKLRYFSYYTWTIGAIIILISLWHS